MPGLIEIGAMQCSGLGVAGDDFDEAVAGGRPFGRER